MNPAPHQTLAELSGNDWGPPPPGASDTIRYQHALRQKPLGKLTTDEVLRLLDLGADADVLVPFALEHPDLVTSVPLLCALLRVRDYNWHANNIWLHRLRNQVYQADHILSHFEGDVDALNKRITLWRMYASFEREI
ncbi:MAG TPA: hypothetical protein VF607_01700 [Verrucomicrobiae bacterium]